MRRGEVYEENRLWAECEPHVLQPMKTLTQAAIWVTTLIVGAALGAYFQPAMQLISELYR